MEIEKIVESLRGFGFFDYYLPFILMFAIFYGLLTKSKIFGEDKKAERINLVIALSASFYLLIFTPVGITLANFFANFFGGTLIIFLTLLILGGILWMGLKITIGKERLEIEKTKYMNILLALVGVGLLLFVFGWAGGFLLFGVEVKEVVIDEVTAFVLGIIVLTLLGMWWMIKPEKEKKS